MFLLLLFFFLFFTFLCDPSTPCGGPTVAVRGRRRKRTSKRNGKKKKKGKVSFLSGSYLSVKIMSCHARVACHISAMYDARGVVAIWDVDNTL